MRFDLGTNKYFDKKIKLHGYLAYGFGDQHLKGMGEIFYLPKKDPRDAYGLFTNDRLGQNYYGEVSQDNIFALAIRKKGIPVKNIKVNEKKIEFFKETFPWMSNRITVTHKSSLPLRNLVPIDSFVATASGKPLTSFEVSRAVFVSPIWSASSKVIFTAAAWVFTRSGKYIFHRVSRVF